MRILTLCLATLLATFVGVSKSDAQPISLTFDMVATDAVVGGTVNWTISVTSATTPFGIDIASTNVTDTGGHTLTPGAIDAAWFIYGPQGGTPSGGDLIALGVSSALNSTALLQGKTATPQILATGSFTAANVGTHSLNMYDGGIGGLANQYYTNGTQATNSGTAYATVIRNGGAYTVTPEPGSALMFGVAMIGLVRRRRG